MQTPNDADDVPAETPRRRGGRLAASDSPESAWLDVMRWTAATAVVFSHMNLLFFVKLSELPAYQRPWPHLLLTAASGFGRPAVIVFFVLSGFLVGGTTFKRYTSEGRFDLLEYCGYRITRLWVVLLPAFLVIATLNFMGSSFSNTLSSPYDEMRNQVGDVSTLIWEFSCNAVFSSHCPPFGGDSPLWSLFNEFWYYVWWGLLLLGYRFRHRAWVVAAAGLCLAISLFYTEGGRGELRNNVAIYFTIWLAGAFASISAPRRLPVSLSVATAMFVCALAGWRLVTPPGDTAVFVEEFGLDLVVASATALLLYQFRGHGPDMLAPPGRALHRSLANCSFSLYVLHVPILRFIAALAMAVFGAGYRMTPIGLGTVVYGLLAVALCVCVSYAFALVTERHTAEARHRVSSLLKRLMRGKHPFNSSIVY